MLTRSVPRFLLEAAFLVAAAAVAALAHLDGIVIVMAASFALVALTEWMVTRKKGRREKPARPAFVVAAPTAATSAPPPRPAPSAPLPSSLRPAAAVPPPLTPPPAPSVVVPDVTPPPLPRRPTPPGMPSAAKPEPTAPPVAAAPPPPPPPAPPPVPVAPKVQRRKWNVFELQHRARSIAGTDPMRDEELTFLLLYLRDFADISGDLSEDFDPFVRESFSELIE